MANNVALSVILPSYKEAENLEILLPKIITCVKELGINYDIFVIDAMNKIDNTEDVCKKNGIKYINRSIGNDYGDAIRTGIFVANGVYSIFMDSDGSHNPADIKRLYDTIVKENCDMVIGSRYCKGGKTDNSFVLIAMSVILNKIYKILFGIKAKDISNSFRIYRTDQIKKLELKCNDFDVVEEILIKLNKSKKNYRIVEIPICFNKRNKGVSKRNLVKFIFSYIKTICRLLRIKNE